MESTARVLRRQAQITDWLRPHLRWITIPSWVMSAVFHVGLLGALIAVSQMPSCRADIQGEGGEDWRTVGIHLREASGGGPESAHRETVQPEAATLPEAAHLPSVTASPVPEQPPVELTLPASNAPPVIGVGGVPATAATSQTVAGLLQPSKGGSTGSGAGVGTGAGGEGGTSLFGLGDKGKRFVYVIDRSYSMESYGALRAAKAELIASLERLDGQQEFQVIFYNQSPLALKPRNERFDIFWGTDAQRLDAVGQINAVTSDGATQHMPALLKALELNPDVVFFLTDGDEPPLTKGDLELIKRRNRRARIHCIQFGKGTRLTDATGKDPGNWVQKLAAQHEGQYTYRDVMRFQARP